MHIGITACVTPFIGVEIDLVGQDGRTIGFDVLRQDLRLFRMAGSVGIGIATIIRHKSHVVFPTATCAVHVANHLINHLRGLRDGTNGKTSHANSHLIRRKISARRIVQKTEIVVGRKRIGIGGELNQ